MCIWGYCTSGPSKLDQINDVNAINLELMSIQWKHGQNDNNTYLWVNASDILRNIFKMFNRIDWTLTCSCFDKVI